MGDGKINNHFFINEKYFIFHISLFVYDVCDVAYKKNKNSREYLKRSYNSYLSVGSVFIHYLLNIQFLNGINTKYVQLFIV